MPQALLEVLALLILALVNGVFALSEIAVVSARPARLERRAEAGAAGAQTALALAQDPGRFLSTVQVGITLVGILSGAFGGATIGNRLVDLLANLPLLAPYSSFLGIGTVVAATTYLSLIVGELVPKQVALGNPEGYALMIARPMEGLSRLTDPIVRFLDASTTTVVRLIGQGEKRRPPVDEHEIMVMLRRGREAGTFEPAEQELIARVFRLADRRLGSLLTPRPDITWLDVDDSEEKNQARIVDSIHARFPVCRGGLDNVLGVVHAKDLLALVLSGEPLDLERAVRKAKFVPESTRALEALDVFKQAGMHIALVMDEYGGLEGLVTTNDVLEALVGEIPLAGERVDLEIERQDDGSWLVDGMLPVEELRDVIELPELPGEERGVYETLGGFVMSYQGSIPRVGDAFTVGGYRFEVVAMEGLRVDQVRLAPSSSSDP
ncbi:MAG: hemolysin family protein [Anaerolineales bacterium]